MSGPRQQGQQRQWPPRAPNDKHSRSSTGQYEDDRDERPRPSNRRGDLRGRDRSPDHPEGDTHATSRDYRPDLQKQSNMRQRQQQNQGHRNNGELVRADLGDRRSPLPPQGVVGRVSNESNANPAGHSDNYDSQRLPSRTQTSNSYPKEPFESRRPRGDGDKPYEQQSRYPSSRDRPYLRRSVERDADRQRHHEDRRFKSSTSDSFTADNISPERSRELSGNRSPASGGFRQGWSTSNRDRRQNSPERSVERDLYDRRPLRSRDHGQDPYDNDNDDRRSVSQGQASTFNYGKKRAFDGKSPPRPVRNASQYVDRREPSRTSGPKAARYKDNERDSPVAEARSYARAPSHERVYPSHIHNVRRGRVVDARRSVEQDAQPSTDSRHDKLAMDLDEHDPYDRDRNRRHSASKRSPSRDSRYSREGNTAEPHHGQWSARSSGFDRHDDRKNDRYTNSRQAAPAHFRSPSPQFSNNADRQRHFQNRSQTYSRPGHFRAPSRDPQAARDRRRSPSPIHARGRSFSRSPPRNPMSFRKPLPEQSELLTGDGYDRKPVERDRDVVRRSPNPVGAPKTFTRQDNHSRQTSDRHGNARSELHARSNSQSTYRAGNVDQSRTPVGRYGNSPQRHAQNEADSRYSESAEQRPATEKTSGRYHDNQSRQTQRQGSRFDSKTPHSRHEDNMPSGRTRGPTESATGTSPDITSSRSGNKANSPVGFQLSTRGTQSQRAPSSVFDHSESRSREPKSTDEKERPEIASSSPLKRPKLEQGQQQFQTPESIPTPHSARMPKHSHNKRNPEVARSNSKETHKTADASAGNGTSTTDGSVYERIGQVGEGTYGKVYKACHKHTGEFVALKRIRMEQERDGFPITSMREIKLLQRLKHPGVVNLLEMMIEKSSVYMVFEYMDHDLTGVLANPNVTFEAPHIKDLAAQLFDGLAYLHHRGVLHRDIKGSNILLNNAGELKLADFGLARFYQRSRINADYTNRVITLWFRPPELLLGATAYDSAVDIWSAGCILLELFTKATIFPGRDEINQLETIYQVMGSPTPESWPGVLLLPWYELIKFQTFPENFDALYEAVLPPAALDLSKQILSLDPSRRPLASEILQHAYFTTELPRAERRTLFDITESHEWDTKQRRRDERAKKIKEEKDRGDRTNTSN